MLYFAAANAPSINFLYKYAWNWPSVVTKYNDEWLFHICASFGKSFDFKLNGDS